MVNIHAPFDMSVHEFSEASFSFQCVTIASCKVICIFLMIFFDDEMVKNGSRVITINKYR